MQASWMRCVFLLLAGALAASAQTGLAPVGGVGVSKHNWLGLEAGLQVQNDEIPLPYVTGELGLRGLMLGAGLGVLDDHRTGMQSLGNYSWRTGLLAWRPYQEGPWQYGGGVMFQAIFLTMRVGVLIPNVSADTRLLLGLGVGI